MTIIKLNLNNNLTTILTIRVSYPTAPGNILWENLDVGFIEKLIRKIISIFSVILLLVITLAIIMAATTIASVIKHTYILL